MNRKLGDKQRQQAHTMRARGSSYREIGKALGVYASTIHDLLNPVVRERRRLQSLQYVTEHREEKRAHDLEYCAANREKRRLYSARYSKEHLEKVRAYDRKYQKENLAYYEAIHSARRAALIGATVGNLAEIKEIYRRAKEDPKVRCYLCGKLIPLRHRHVDHITPLSRGGAHRPSNLAVACDTCNMRKHDKLPEELGVLL